MTDWQPIETAPKDGRTIYLPVGECAVPAFWCDDLKRWVLVRTWKMDYVENPSGWRPTAHKSEP